MIVFENGNYETGDWLTVETYPERVSYVVEEGSELAIKIATLYPYYTLNIVDGILIDVIEREKTQAEIDAENAPAPKTADQLRIEQLEAILYKPNPNEIFLSLDVENTELEDLKQKKIEQLDFFCNTTILSGFVSNCLGVDNTYVFSMEDQINMAGQKIEITDAEAASLTIPPIYWKASGIPQEHSMEQFKLLYNDGLNHKKSNINQYWTLKTQVLSASTKADVMLIEW